jgi:hypothetical protein
MVTKTKLDRMDEQVTAFLAGHLAHAPLLRQEMLELWSAFRDLGLPCDDFAAELTNGKAESFAQRVWEMMLGRHLHLQGHAPVCPNGGPDFRVDLGGRTVWVEATAPLPVGLPPEWLDPNYRGVGNFPHEEMLLRWTTALDAKWKKYIQYRKKGIVGAADAYVIAINGCLLSAFPTSRGISQMPFGVEAVFPVGPLAYRVDGATGKIRDGHISERFHIVNANNAHIPTTPFVDPRYSGVSALIGSVATRCDGKPLDLHVVHNPLADVPLPHGALGAQDDEWFATPVDGIPGEFELHRPTEAPAKVPA